MFSFILAIVKILTLSHIAVNFCLFERTFGLIAPPIYVIDVLFETESSEEGT
jgi:hypothetical protein